jgi:hypothetical protein
MWAKIEAGAFMMGGTWKKNGMEKKAAEPR